MLIGSIGCSTGFSSSRKRCHLPFLYTAGCCSAMEWADETELRWLLSMLVFAYVVASIVLLMIGIGIVEMETLIGCSLSL